jgi:uncharacterized protein (DUF58 family)
MKLFPERRLIRVAALWLVAATLCSAWPILFWPTGVLLAFLVGVASVDAVLIRRSPPVLIQRILPSRAVVGRSIETRIRIENRSTRPTVISADDEWPEDLGGASPSFENVLVEAGSCVDLCATLSPRRLGDRPLGRLVVFERGPLGLLRRRSIDDREAVVPVYPNTRRLLRAAGLDPRELLGRSGLQRSRRRDHGSEFESLREYVIGDDPRHVDWAATARHGHLVTRLFQHERNFTLVIAVDTSRLMAAKCSDGRTKLDHAVDASLTLALAALGRGDRVEIVLFDRTIHGHVAPRGHRGEIGPIVDLLRRSEPTTVESNYRGLVRGLLMQRRGRALVVVLTDFADSETAGIEAPLRLLQKHHRTLTVALRDPMFARLGPGGPSESHDPFEKLAIDELLVDREMALARLRRAAVQTLDLPPEHVIAPLLNRYLEFRYSGA